MDKRRLIIGSIAKARLQTTKKAEFFYDFALAMSYGNPSIKEALEKLKEQNCKKLLVLPMYPQYSAATVASVFDEVCTQLKKWRWIPELRFINQYHDEKIYIDAIAASFFSAQKIEKKIAKNQKIIFSYHGTPLQSLLDGDPYHCHCNFYNTEFSY